MACFEARESACDAPLPIAPAAIVAAWLVVRPVFLVQLERSEFGDVLSLDSRSYYDLARAISAGGAPPGGALDFNPLYPAFLVVVSKLFGTGLPAPRIVQFALGLFTSIGTIEAWRPRVK